MAVYHRNHRSYCCLFAMALLVAAAAAEDRTGQQPAPLQFHYGLPPPPPPPPAPSHRPDTTWDDETRPQGFTVQSGYSGLVVPEAEGGDSLDTLHKLGGVALGASLLAHLLPFPFNHVALFLGSKVGLWLLSFGALLLLGGAATTALCALTPVCTISFLGFGLTRESTRALLTKDRLDAAARFVRDAVHRWTELQDRDRDQDEAKKREARKRKKATTAPATAS